MAGPGDITLVEGAVHNPNEPRHFMRIVPAARRCTAVIASTTIADSTAALIVKEVGRDIYDPVVYFPRTDIDMALLAPIDTTTSCPVKGTTEYFDVDAPGGRIAEAAWSYVGAVVGGAEPIEGFVAFDSTRIEVHS